MPRLCEAGAVLRTWSRGGALAAIASVGSFVVAEATRFDAQKSHRHPMLAAGNERTSQTP
jgi:hypothetical protein